MTTIDPRLSPLPALLRAVCDEPEEDVVKLVYADALEEAGRLNEAAGMRWAADNKRRPFLSGSYQWWFCRSPFDGDLSNYDPEDVPKSFGSDPMFSYGHHFGWVSFVNGEEAWQWFIRRFAELREGGKI